MAENKKIPEIRFAGFTDVWGQRKLGDEVIEIVVGGDVDKSLLDENGKYYRSITSLPQIYLNPYIQN